MASPKKSRLAAGLEDHPIVTVVSLLTVLVVGITSVVTAVGWVRDEVHDRYLWRGDEYRKLTELHAGLSTGVFHEELGAPEFVSANGAVHEELFRGRDYWVQTLSDSGGTVGMYLITSCDESFSPTFDIPGYGNLTLRETTFSEIAPADKTGHTDVVRALYVFSGATGNNRYLENAYSGNPGNYQEFAWGLTDPCRDFLFQIGPRGHLIDVLYRASEAAQGSSADLRPRFSFKGFKSHPPPLIQKFRSEAVANTYAEVMPQHTFKEYRGELTVGVDRLRTRVIDGPPENGIDRPTVIDRIRVTLAQLFDPVCRRRAFRYTRRCYLDDPDTPAL